MDSAQHNKIVSFIWGISDEVLRDLSADQIRQSIAEPDAEVTEGFSPGLMPDYGESLSEAQVDGLVKYLEEVSGR